MFNLSALASTPDTPVSGRVRVFVNASGNLCSVDSTGTVVVYGTGVTAEIVEDIVGSMLQDTASVNVTYNDAGAAITLDVLPGGVNHNALLNYVTNQHVDHSTVSVSAGTGLTGGGDITANRTISMPNVGTAGTYGSATLTPVITTDAQGRVSSITETTPVLNIPTSITLSSTLITTTSTTYVVMTGQTITPAAGTYVVTGRACISATSNSRTIELALFLGGVIVADTGTTAFIRTGSGFGSNTDIENETTFAVITVNGSQAIDLRWQTSGGTAQARGYGLLAMRIS